jgi:phosphatidate phosphatase APP1
MHIPRVSNGDWRERLQRLASDVGAELQRAGAWAVFGPDRLHEIVGYRGYGNGQRVLVQGRALQAKNLVPSSDRDSAWHNLLNTYKRIESGPLRRARVCATIGAIDHEIVADDEGFFRAWLDLPEPLPRNEPWHPVDLRLVSPLRADQPHVRATAPVRIPSSSAAFGVISDLDDTVIQSRVANLLQAVRTIMLGNARTRLPFPGVAAFYQALERGAEGGQRNPIFYVSSSPWNIYDVIAEFLELQRIPVGPICLRDWDIELAALESSRIVKHKEPLIREILDLYQDLPFILIGDSGQHDPEIYRTISREFRGRILAIYIRNVDPDPERSAAIQALAEEVLAAGSSLILADDTAAAAKHAAEHGWIAPDALSSVYQEKKADEGQSGTKADAPGASDNPEAPTIVVE